MEGPEGQDTPPPPPIPPEGGNIQNEYLSAGEKFGDYQVMQCLSFGMLGALYRMQHISTFEECCLCVLPPAVNLDPTFKERFQKNIKLLSGVVHPNVLGVIDGVMVKDRYCMFMELVEATNFADHLERHVLLQKQMSGKITTQEAEALLQADTETLADREFGMPPSEVREIMLQAADGVHLAHSAGLHHVNLNPTNLLRLSDGGVKVFGLGLYDLIGHDLFSQLTSSRNVTVPVGLRSVTINTFDILSPEVRAGGEPDARADVYDLGLSAYYLLTGQKPMGGYVPPSAECTASKGWDVVVGRCLAALPDNRYDSASELREDLEEVDNLGKNKAEREGIAKHIQVIPLPKSVKEKASAPLQQALRVAMLLVFSLVCVSGGWYSFKVLMTDMGEDATLVKRARPGMPPDITLTISPETAQVSFGAKGNFMATNGKLEVILEPGQYTFSVSAPGYKNSKSNITFDEEPLTIPVKLKPAWGLFELTAPAGATVTAFPKKGDPVVVGEVPETGIYRMEEKLLAGEYAFEVSKEFYQTAKIEPTRLPVDKLVTGEVKLEPIPASLEITTEPVGATVTVDGKEMGKSPVKMEGLPTGEAMRIEVSLDMYRPKTVTFELDPGAVEVLDFGALERRTGSLLPKVTFNGAAPTEAQLEQTRLTVGDQEFPAFVTRVSPIDMGETTVIVAHPDYVRYKNTVTIPDGGTLNLVFDLLPRPGVLTLGFSKNVPFTLKVNGRDLAPMPDDPRKFELPAGRQYAFEVHVPDHLTARRTLGFGPNEKKNWDVELVTIPGPEFEKPWIVPYAGVGMIWLKPGSFTLGSPRDEQKRLPDEGPETPVTISRGFWMSEHEVTQVSYKAVTGQSPSRYEGPMRPVENVSWDDAVRFCQKINAQEKAAGRLPDGFEYRLPTEAEWEYACRAGTTTAFHFGPNADPTMSNFKGAYPREYAESAPEGKDTYGTVNVGSYKPNAFGLYDMHGNVAEWCRDWFNARYPERPVTDPTGPDSGTDRLHRGGGWKDYAYRCRSGARQRIRATTVSDALGLRLVLAPVIQD